MKFLSQEWLDAARTATEAQSAHPGAAARVQFVIAGAPGGDVKYGWVLDDGRVLESNLGSLADPDVTVTAPYAEWAEIARGDLDPSTAYMRGVAKVAGDTGKWLRVLAVTATPEYRASATRLHETTEYPGDA